MTSYLPPRVNKHAFNSSEFQSNLSADQIESKIKKYDAQLVL